MIRELLTVDETAALLGVSKYSLYGWHRQGIGPDRIRVGHSIRYDRAVIYAWIDSNIESPRTA